MEAIAGCSLEEIDAVFKYAHDKFDGIKQDGYVLKKLIDNFGAYLQEVRQQAKERTEGEHVFTADEDAEYVAAHKKKWNMTLPELEQRLQEEVATLEMFRGGFTPEVIDEAERKIKSLTEDIETEKAYLATRAAAKTAA